MPKIRKKSSPDVDNSNPTKSRARAGRTSKMATPNTNLSKSGARKTVNISQPNAQSQPHTPQQYIIPGAFQYPQFMGNLTPMNSCSPTFMQQPSMTNGDPLLQTIFHKIESIEGKLGQLGEIHSAVNTITVRLDGMDKKIEEMEHSQQFISTQYESVSSSISNSKDELSETNTEVKRLPSENEG